MSDETITLPCGAVMRPWSDAVFDDWRVCDATAALGMLRRTVPCIAWFGDDMRSGAESTCLAWLDERIREARAALLPPGAIVVRDDPETREAVAKALLGACAKRYGIRLPPSEETIEMAGAYADAVLAALRERAR